MVTDCPDDVLIQTQPEIAGWVWLGLLAAVVAFEVWALQTGRHTLSQWLTQWSGRVTWLKWFAAGVLAFAWWHWFV